MNTPTVQPTRSTIRMLAPRDFVDGVCCLCSEPARIKFHDSATGWRLGDCCLHATIAAERALSISLTNPING